MQAELIQKWLEAEGRQRSKEARRRIANGLGHAELRFIEQVWLPAFQQLEGLHPEYEVRDFKDGTRFIDFAYIRGSFKLCIEIDGYGPHWRDQSRWQFADHLMRQNHLIIDGWIVMRFTFDEINEKPRRAQQVLQQLFGRWLGSGDGGSDMGNMNSNERDIIRLALLEGSITAKGASAFLGLTIYQVRYLLQRMAKKGIIVPVNNGHQRVHRYQLGRAYYLRDALGN